MRVRVSDWHIDESVRGDSHHCMIADAVKDACSTAQYIQADVQSIRFSDPSTGKRYVYMTPPVAQSANVRQLRPARGEHTGKQELNALW